MDYSKQSSRSYAMMQQKGSNFHAQDKLGNNQGTSLGRLCVNQSFVLLGSVVARGDGTAPLWAKRLIPVPKGEGCAGGSFVDESAFSALTDHVPYLAFEYFFARLATLVVGQGLANQSKLMDPE